MASRGQEGTLLGVCDGQLDPQRHGSSYLTNKVGGRPDWPPVISPPCPRCGCCGAPLAHVVQVYCPLNSSPYHRNLHVFACLGTECGGRSESWTVLRSQYVEGAPRTPGRPDPALRVTDWCDTAEEWGTEEEDGDGRGGEVEETSAPEGQVGETDVSSCLQDLSLGEVQEDVPAFCPFFISVVEESDLCGEDDDDLEHAEELLREYERREGVVVAKLEGSSGSGEERYEKTRARHGDTIFSSFMKMISGCPQQILRYCHGGKPLFISEPPSNMAQLVSACGSCGGSRTFELQLMPALVSLLQPEGGSVGAELEFGTVLVYTCVNSCWTSGSHSAVEEVCFVQTDPDQQLFK